ncbi:hypothetical protein ASD42_03505 [Nocardia sp. Root136]|nr:hypothetical protein ASD42_03505 [Nocardia sp. Root136]
MVIVSVSGYASPEELVTVQQHTTSPEYASHRGVRRSIAMIGRGRAEVLDRECATVVDLLGQRL